MRDDPIPDEDHVARYCSPARVEDGVPLAAAFRMRPTERYLSVNWLEYWESPSMSEALDLVKRDFALRISGAGRFAVLNVSDAKETIEWATHRPASVTHQPTVRMRSHAGVFGYSSDDLAVAAELAASVSRDRVFQAR